MAQRKRLGTSGLRNRLSVLLAVGMLVAIAGIGDVGAAGEPLGRVQRLIPPDPIDGAEFGTAVAIDGETLVIGSPYEDWGGEASRGAVDVYHRDPDRGMWVHAQRLTDPTPAGNDWFGRSVAVEGSTIVVGTPLEGAVHLFELDPMTLLWGYSATLTGGGATWFGFAIDLDGDILVVGAHVDERVFVFRHGPTGWVEDAGSPLENPDVGDGDFFGYAVAVSGDWIAVGAPRDGGAGADAGIVQVFEYSGSSWEYAQPLGTAADAPAAGAGLGSSIAMSSLTIAAGAQSDDTTGVNRGSIHVFTLNPMLGVWASVQPPLLDASGDAANGDHLGWSVAMNADRIVAGAPSPVGSVVMFDLVSGFWSFAGRLESDLPQKVGYLGADVDLDGNWIVGGAPYEDHEGGADQGTVYLFAETVPPVVTISSPLDGEEYEIYSLVLTDYACTDEGTGVASCFAFGPSGSPLYTGEIGDHDFWAQAYDNVGNWTAEKATYTVVDTGLPDVDLKVPADGASFEQGTTVAADFGCEDAGSGIDSCLGTVPDGYPIDTSMAGGPYEFTVTATDNAGNTTAVTHRYSVVPGTCNGLPVTLVVPPGGDRFDGTEEDDVILGTDGPDVISGLGGNDTICGEGGDDLVLGGPGDDTLLGGDGNDKLRGAAGDDTLLGEGGSDRLLPETGNDTADGGAGSDIVDYLAGKGPVVVDLSAGTAVYSPIGGGVWTHTLVLVEKADGTRYDDSLTGDWKRNVLRGKQGVDQIWGLGGDDDLIGGTHDDTILGGDGDDLVKGQANDDVLRGEGGADKVVGGAGNDTLRGGFGDDLLIGGLKAHLASFVNALDGGAGWDTCRWEAFTSDCEQ